MENIYTRCFEIVLNRVQCRLANIKVNSEEEALSIIAKEVFEYCRNQPEIEDYHKQRIIIQKIYFKTRTRLNILQPLIDDNEVTEIMVNGYDQIFYEKNNIIKKYEMHFDSNDEVVDVMQAIASYVNREVNELNPILDARLPDGSRVNGVFSNIAIKGPSMTIRKFTKEVMSVAALIENGTLTNECALLLKVFVKCGYNIFISGGTSSGKTTLINALSNYIDKGERVVVIEDSAELKLSSIENLVQMECRNSNVLGKGKVTISDLLKNSLRMRPDRIIVGEVRGEEVFYMLQALNTGHSGMSTGHGNSIHGMLKRLETMYLMEASIDIEAIRRQITEAIDIMIHIEKQGKNRKIVEIAELVGYENDDYILNILAKQSVNGKVQLVGNDIIQTRKIALKGEKYIDELRKIGIGLS